MGSDESFDGSALDVLVIHNIFSFTEFFPLEIDDTEDKEPTLKTLDFVGKKNGLIICLFPNIAVHRWSFKLYPLQFMENMFFWDISQREFDRLFGLHDKLTWLNNKTVHFSGCYIHDSDFKFPQHGRWVISYQGPSVEDIKSFCMNNPHVLDNIQYKVKFSGSTRFIEDVLLELSQDVWKHVHTNFEILYKLNVYFVDEVEFLTTPHFPRLSRFEITAHPNVFANITVYKQIQCQDQYDDYETEKLIKVRHVPMKDWFELFSHGNQHFYDQIFRYSASVV
jgi:hypothetical protein